MWFSETFEKTVNTVSVQVTFSCWHFGGNRTWSQLSPIWGLDHIWQLQNFIFLAADMISVSRSPKIAKAGLNFIFPCWKSHQGILFSYGTLIHAYSERYSYDNCASGIALSKRAAAGTEQFSCHLTGRTKTCSLHCWKSVCFSQLWVIPAGKGAE